MALDGITGTVTATVPASTSSTTRAPKQTMDSDMFMQLMVTQLQNQDPSSPMDTNAMIGQTTQLAMMEQITNNTTTGKDVSGKAASVSFAGSVPTVSVGGKDVPLDSISGIVDATSTAAAPAAS